MERPTCATTLAQIIEAWADLTDECVARSFPRLRARWIGWREPFCFRCGWLVPLPRRARARGAQWNLAAGWLERAHLRDRDHDGSDDPLNLVPLCPLCHEQQPESETRADGIAHVNTPSDYYVHLGWIAQLITDRDYAGRLAPGKDALRCLLRAYTEAGALFAATVVEEGRIPGDLAALAAEHGRRDGGL